MPSHKCSYFRCANTSDQKSMFRFPWKDENRLKVWLDKCGNLEIAHLPPTHLRSRYLCIDHFKMQYIRNKTGKRKRLKRTAVPNNFQSIELPDQSSSILPVTVPDEKKHKQPPTNQNRARLSRHYPSAKAKTMKANKRKTQASKTSDDTLLLSEGAFIRACRVCLDVNTKLHCLQSNDLFEYYAELNLPPVCNSDGLPQFICIYCRHLLMKAVKFRRKCIATMNFLRTQLSLESITTDYFENLNRADFKLPYEKSDTETFDFPEILNLNISDIKKEEPLEIEVGIVHSHSGLDDGLAVEGYLNFSDEQKELNCNEINSTLEVNFIDMNSNKEPSGNLSEELSSNGIKLNTEQNFKHMNSSLEHYETENKNDVNVKKEQNFSYVEVKIEPIVSDINFDEESFSYKDQNNSKSQSNDNSVDFVETHNSSEKIDEDEFNVYIKDEECCIDYSDENEALLHNKEDVAFDTPNESDSDNENTHEYSNTENVVENDTLIEDDDDVEFNIYFNNEESNFSNNYCNDKVAAPDNYTEKDMDVENLLIPASSSNEKIKNLSMTKQNSRIDVSINPTDNKEFFRKIGIGPHHKLQKRTTHLRSKFFDYIYKKYYYKSIEDKNVTTEIVTDNDIDDVDVSANEKKYNYQKTIKLIHEISNDTITAIQKRVFYTYIRDIYIEKKGKFDFDLQKMFIDFEKMEDDYIKKFQGLAEECGYTILTLSPEEMKQEQLSKREMYIGHKFHCKDCFFIFPSKMRLQKHYKIYHDPSLGPAACKLCGKRKANAQCLFWHWLKHKYRFQCNKCQITFDDGMIMQHKCHDKGSFTCDGCGNKFISRTMMQHQKCHGKGAVKCDACGKKFRTGVEYYRDDGLQDPESDGRFNCELCCRTLGSNDALAAHYRMAHRHRRAQISRKILQPENPTYQKEMEDDSSRKIQQTDSELEQQNKRKRRKRVHQVC